MLNQLSIRNVAVIDSLDVSLRGGMTVLTGETGAGKSIIIDSINMILGERASKELIRYGKERAGVQGVFDSNAEITALLEENGIDVEDNRIIITRQINNEGKSVARVNGIIVTLAFVRELASMLINIHGQHDNQALLNPKKHIDFLDSFAQSATLKAKYQSIYREMKSLEKEIKSLQMDEQEKLRRIDLLKYQSEEIAKAMLKEGEEEELKEQLEIYENAEKITSSLDRAYKNLYENDSAPSAYDSLSIAVSAIEEIKDFNEELGAVYESLSSAMYAVEDAAHEMSQFGDSVEYDEAVLNDIEERLDLISKLKRKYGATIEEINAFGERAAKELEGIEQSDEREAQMKAELENKRNELKKAGNELSKLRKTAAKELGERIEASLHELNMEKSHMSVEVDSGDEFFENGMDSVEFLISTNPGEPVKPLVKIASGGELSRVMLAIKSILAADDGVSTLIFDEIDTGVSGKAALKIANKLKEIGRYKQVICITHLPQLTAAADNHYLINKETKDGMASTSLTFLDDEGRVMELARLIDGGEVSESAYNHAKELLINSKSNK